MSELESKDVRDEINLAIGKNADGILLAGIIFSQHGMTQADNIEDCKPVVHLMPAEAEMLALNLVRMAFDIRRQQQALDEERRTGNRE